MQEVTTCDTEIVSALRAALTELLGPQRFELWFGEGTQLVLSDEALQIYSPNPFMQGWLRSCFRRELETCARDVLGRDVALEFLVSEEPEATPLESGSGLCAATPEPDAAALPEPNGNRRAFNKLEAFVVGRSNRLAYTSAQMVTDRVGSLSPLFLHGPTGVGKTHLLEGIWSAVRTRQRDKHVVYLSAEQFTTFFLEALHGSGLPNFRRKYRGVDLLLIDDVQFLCGKRATIGELLHTIDTLMRDGRQLVLSADRPPAELTGLGHELLTRLEGGLIGRIEPPDFETRLGIVRQMAGKLGLDVPRQVQEYVATHLTSHARELAGALNCLQATSLAHEKPISLSMAEEALCDCIRQSSRAVRLADIEKAVCNVFGLEPDSLQAGSKAKAVSGPRMLAMWLARKHTRAAMAEIGRYFGRRSHSTVITAQKKITSWMAHGEPVEMVDHRWTIEEAIRRVEAQMRAG
jgi:chromosomal replication initiator protein